MATARCSRWRHGSGTITTLASFNGTNGARSRRRPGRGQQRQSLRHDRRWRRRWLRHGVRVAAGSGTITTLASFNDTNGANPDAGLVEDSSGNLFGTTVPRRRAMATARCSRWRHGSGTITTLASFNGTNGANPYAGLVEDSSGNLFGTDAFRRRALATARCSRWRTAAARSPPWPRSTAPTAPIPTPA